MARIATHIGGLRYVPNVAAVGTRTGWWNAGGVDPSAVLAVYQPKGAASLAASYQNLASPGTYDAAPGTAPSFNTATGWAFAAASSQYLTTGIASALTQTFIVRVSGVSDANSYAFGSYKTSVPSYLVGISPLNGGKAYFYYQLYGAYTLATGAAAGVFAVSALGAYLNGSSVGTLGGVSGNPSLPYFIGCLNTAGVPNYFISGNVLALAIYGATLTAPQVAAVSTAMAAL